MIRMINNNELERVRKFAEECFKVDFAKIQPKVYVRGNSSSNTYVYEEDGCILGSIATYSFTYDDLSFVGIGTLCVDPAARGKGIMQKLFDFILTEVVVNFDISYLSGDRVRYERFGYYRTGTRYNYAIKKAKNYIPIVSFEEITEENDSLSRFYHGLVSRKENFFLTLTTNYNKVFGIYDENHDQIGYLVYKEKDKRICEVSSSIDIIDVLNSFEDYLYKTQSDMYVNYVGDYNKELFEMCEYCSCHSLINIRIENYPKILNKFALLQNSSYKLTFSNELGNIRIENNKVYYDDVSYDKLSFKELSYIIFSDLYKDKNNSIKLSLPSSIVDIDSF